MMDFSRVTFTKMPAEVTKKQRQFFEDRVRRQFVKYLAYTNQFDKILTDKEIEIAKTGYLPDDLDIHHIFPISGTDSKDTNSFTNLSILHKNTHKAINKRIFDPQLAVLINEPDYTQIDIWLPHFEPVDGDRILAYRNNDTRLPADIKYGLQILNVQHGFAPKEELFKKTQPTKKEIEFLKNNLRGRL